MSDIHQTYLEKRAVCLLKSDPHVVGFRLPTPRPGEVLGLVGTNGIGKSTALKILAGKQKPNLGRFSVSYKISIVHIFLASKEFPTVRILCIKHHCSLYIHGLAYKPTSHLTPTRMSLLRQGVIKQYKPTSPAGKLWVLYKMTRYIVDHHCSLSTGDPCLLLWLQAVKLLPRLCCMNSLSLYESLLW